MNIGDLHMNDAREAVDVPTLAAAMVDALREGELDVAESMLDELHAADPQTKDLLVFPVIIRIQRGQIREALQLVLEAGQDRFPELKALCLQLLGDPSWYGEAMALIDGDDVTVRRAMRELMGDFSESSDGCSE